jgi:hypothetical protein
MSRKRTPEEKARSEEIGARLRQRFDELMAAERRQSPTTPDPEDLSEDERREILDAVRARIRRETENQVIRAELKRRALEAERKAS